MWAVTFAFFVGLSLSFGWRFISRQFRPDGIYVELLSTTNETHTYLNTYSSANAIKGFLDSVCNLFSFGELENCDCGCHGEVEDKVENSEKKGNIYNDLIYQMISDPSFSGMFSTLMKKFLNNETLISISQNLLNSDNDIIKNLVNSICLDPTAIKVADFAKENIASSSSTNETPENVASSSSTTLNELNLFKDLINLNDPNNIGKLFGILFTNVIQNEADSIVEQKESTTDAVVPETTETAIETMPEINEVQKETIGIDGPILSD